MNNELEKEKKIHDSEKMKEIVDIKRNHMKEVFRINHNYILFVKIFLLLLLLLFFYIFFINYYICMNRWRKLCLPQKVLNILRI